MSAARPGIPEAVRRQVRRECYFGCVICGSPVFDYDHMIDYAVNPEHKADNLVLLCRMHHLDKTAGRLSLERVRHAKSNPANKKRMNTASYKLEGNSEVEILIGSNRSSAKLSEETSSHHALWVNGVGYLVLHFEDGWLTFSMIATDSAGKVLLAVDRGQMTVTTQAWDYRYEGTTLKIWAGRGEVLFEADISNHRVHVVKGMFLTAGADGFIVNGDMMVAISSGKEAGFYIGCICHDCTFGSWAFARMALLPEGRPKGFGMVRVIGEI